MYTIYIATHTNIMSDYINVHVAVIRTCKKSDLCQEDLGLEGVYVATVAKGLTLETTAAAAIDRFHEAQAVECVDDFLIFACDPQTGVVIGDASSDNEHLELCPSIEKLNDDRLKLYTVFVSGLESRVVAPSRAKAIIGCLDRMGHKVEVRKGN